MKKENDCSLTLFSIHRRIEILDSINIRNTKESYQKHITATNGWLNQCDRVKRFHVDDEAMAFVAEKKTNGQNTTKNEPYKMIKRIHKLVQTCIIKDQINCFLDHY